MMAGATGGGGGGGEGVTARAFRFYVPRRMETGTTGTTSTGYMNIAMNLMNTVGGENICTTIGGGTLVAGATYSQSSAYASQYDAKNGFGYFRANSGIWHSASQAAPWWAWIDFGAGNEKTIREISIKPVNAFENQRAPFEFYFQSSPDHVTWTDVLHVTDITGWVLETEKAWVIP